MSEPLKFHAKGFLVKIYTRSYLVEVQQSHNKQPVKNGSIKFPEWVFGSKHAIWLTNENLPLKLRAKHGDHIKSMFSRDPFIQK